MSTVLQTTRNPPLSCCLWTSHSFLKGTVPFPSLDAALPGAGLASTPGAKSPRSWRAAMGRTLT